MYGEGKYSAQRGLSEVSAERNVKIVIVLLTSAYIVAAQSRSIDVQKSAMTERVFKARLFVSALGHDHMQSDFSIKPMKLAGGVVGVKDEVRIEFDVTLTQGGSAQMIQQEGNMIRLEGK